MIETLSHPMSLLGIATGIAVMVIWIIAERQNNKKPPESSE